MPVEKSWTEELRANITVTDANGKIIELNQSACVGFAPEGGAALIGSNVFDCHPEPALTETRLLFKTQKPSHYTIRKKGQKKIIHQMPWYRDGAFAGFVEISIPIPDELPHFERG